jgi:hypothetical protein
MTHKEQQAVRELKKTVAKTLKSLVKEFGYKLLSGWIYKVVNDYLYLVNIDVYPVSLGKYISTKISVKPLIIDNIFWEVYEMDDLVKITSISPHISASEGPYPLIIKEYNTPAGPTDEVDYALIRVFEEADSIINEYNKRFTDISSFKSELEGREDEHSVLGIILCDIAEGNYKEALSITKEEIKKGNIGSFAKYDENGVTGINEYLEKYLMARLRDVSS